MLADGTKGECGAVVEVGLAADAAIFDNAGAGLEREDQRGQQRLRHAAPAPHVAITRSIM